ncbi:MAG: NAD-dependent epimerase/dehydratase family protein, partial [Bdellovibrionota bacterium]
MKQKYLVTGGSGFIGTNLAREVLKRGHPLMVFDNLSRLGCAANLDWLRTFGNFEYFHGDIRVESDIAKAVRDFKPDVVFHLAGQVAMTTSVARPQHDFAINGIGTVNLLEALRLFCPDARMTLSSSNKVYGRMKGIALEEGKTRYFAPGYEKGFDEELGLDFETPYCCSKGVADQYALEYARTFNLNTVVFRHSTVFGGRQFASFDQGWVTWFAMKALEQKSGKGEAFTISGDGKQVRDVLFIDDLIDCYFMAVDQMDRVR